MECNGFRWLNLNSSRHPPAGIAAFHPDSDNGEDLAGEVRNYHIPDFSSWKNHDAFERAFAPPAFRFGATSRLEKDLRTSLR